VGIVHQTLAQRGRTIDARPNEPDAGVEPFMVLARHIERLEERIAQQEAALRALHDTVTELQAALHGPVTHNVYVTPVPPGRNAVTGSVTSRNAERQRRYRARKKAHGADPQR
jgi:hypothetical protein